ncbi:unnamed protein product [Lota lota]
MAAQSLIHSESFTDNQRQPSRFGGEGGIARHCRCETAVVEHSKCLLPGFNEFICRLLNGPKTGAGMTLADPSVT